MMYQLCIILHKYLSLFQVHKKQHVHQATGSPVCCPDWTVQCLHCGYLCHAGPCSVWNHLCSHALLLSCHFLVDGIADYPHLQKYRTTLQKTHWELSCTISSNLLGYVKLVSMRVYLQYTHYIYHRVSAYLLIMLQCPVYCRNQLRICINTWCERRNLHAIHEQPCTPMCIGLV